MRLKIISLLVIIVLLATSMLLVVFGHVPNGQGGDLRANKRDFSPKQVDVFETSYIHVGVSTGADDQGPCITEMWSKLDYPSSTSSEPHDIFGLGEYEYIQVDGTWSAEFSGGDLWFKSNDRYSIRWEVSGFRIEKYVELSKIAPLVIISYRITNLDESSHEVNFYVATDMWEYWTGYPHMYSKIYTPSGNIIAKSGWYEYHYVIEQLHPDYPFEPGEDWVFMGVDKGVRARVYVGWWIDAVYRWWRQGLEIAQDADADKGFLIELGTIKPGEEVRFKVYYGASNSYDGIKGVIAQVYEVRVAPRIENAWALLVGIADYYPPGSGGPDLHYTDDDAIDFYNKLIEWGWDEDNIQLLINESATGSNINASLNWIASHAEADDIVLFFFSGHGTHISDPEGEEHDGYDEALVPYDYPQTGDLITDDELEELLSQIKSKHIIVILDSCYSGGFIEKELQGKTLVAKTLPGKDLVKLTDGFEEDIREAGRVILTCGNYDEACYEYELYENGVWTYWVLRALGSSPAPSDENNDRIVSAEETYVYAANELAHSPFSDYQHPQLYDGTPSQVPLVWHLAPAYIYWFTWYDMRGARWDAIHLTNLGSNDATIEIYIAGTLKDTITLSPLTSTYKTYPDVKGGPVKIISTEPLSVSQRILGWNSFVELPAMSDSSKSNKVFFNWYDMKDAQWDAIHIINPSNRKAIVEVYIGGELKGVIEIGPGEAGYVTYPGVRSGPVILKSNTPILSSQRIIGWGNFEEVWGTPME